MEVLSLPDEKILLLECVVAGTTFLENLNEIERMIEKVQRLELKQEQDNKHDSFAIAIYNSQGDKLSYIPRSKNEMLVRLIQVNGFMPKCKIKYGKVTG